MDSKKLKKIFENFVCQGVFSNATALTSGHINETYIVETSDLFYVLQKLNHLVFPNIPELMDNKLKIAQHLTKKKGYQLALLQFYPTKTGPYYLKDEEGSFWSLMNYIPGSKVLDKTEHKDQAYEAGKAFGHFIAQLDDFDASELYEIIPNFHKMSFRYAQFDEALKNGGEERKKEAEVWIQQVLENRDKMHRLEKLYEQGIIPMRVTHNDTKLSNILFDENDRALAVIDWDTLMPGIVHYDFGDSIRSICSTTTEDEAELSKINFDYDFYQSYKVGFLEELENTLSEKEIELLPLAAQTITFIMGLRFLTDYLNGDAYYKIKYPKHNLVRAANQLTLVKRMEEVFE